MDELEERRRRAREINSDHAKARVEVHRMWTNVIVLAMFVATGWGVALIAVFA